MSDSTLSPLSISVLMPAILAAHRRLRNTLSLPPSPSALGKTLFTWRRNSLADIILQSWQADPQRLATLLQHSPSSLTAMPGGKTKKMLRVAVILLEAAPAKNQRLQHWAEGVQVMSWSQSQLLQVMEEVEPMIALAIETVEEMAWAALGSYLLLTKTLARWFAADAPEWAMNLVLGVETPDSQQVDDLAQRMSVSAWQERWGHRADFELELASPRLAELDLSWWPQTSASVAWSPQQAQQRSHEAQERAVAKAGWLQRSSLQKQIMLARQALAAYGEAQDSLAKTLAATRRWCLAAAAEGREGDRIHEPDEVFRLELEEIKQMMTGEWHHRRFVESQITTRVPEIVDSPSTRSTPLRIVDSPSLDGATPLSRPEAISPLEAGSVALVERTSALWTPLFLRAGGVVISKGSFLAHGAAVARGGGVPLLVSTRKQSP